MRSHVYSRNQSKGKENFSIKKRVKHEKGETRGGTAREQLYMDHKREQTLYQETEKQSIQE